MKNDPNESKVESISDVFSDILSKIETDLHRSEEKRKKIESERRKVILKQQQAVAQTLPIYVHIPPQLCPDISAAKRLVHMYKLDYRTPSAFSAEGGLKLEKVSEKNSKAVRAMERGAFTKTEKYQMDGAAKGNSDIMHIPDLIETNCGEIWRKLEDVMKREMEKQAASIDTDNQASDEQTTQNAVKKLDNDNTLGDRIMEHPQVLVKTYDNCISSSLCPAQYNRLQHCWKMCIKFITKQSAELQDPQNELKLCFDVQCGALKEDVGKCINTLNCVVYFSLICTVHNLLIDTLFIRTLSRK